MKLKEIHRASTFAWGPTPGESLIATGTVAGALDASFSNESQLEIWNPDFADVSQFDLGGESQEGVIATVVTSARFNRLAWGAVDAARPKGIIAGGMENGDLSLWDPAKLIGKENETIVFSNSTHSGPIRGLDFNPLQINLLSSGGINGEIYIWNLQEPSKPYTPGTRSSKLDEIASLAWNRQVPYILATSGNTGYTVVWDLRNKREVAALAFTGTTVAQVGGGMAMGGRKGMSDVTWHPGNATRLVTSSEDDTSPVVMLWDLRNARAPEKVLNGHEKGVLSVSWCKQDADLLLSCGKDNRSICWNPQTSEILGELPIANNWAFQVQFNSANPSLVANAAFDGTISLHNTQSVLAPDADVLQSQSVISTQAEGADIFDLPQMTLNQSQPSLNLLQAPKWLKTPTSASWGYGGKLVSVSNLPSASGTNQSSVVHLRDISTEKGLVGRIQKLKRAVGEKDGLKGYVEEKAKQKGPEEGTWRALLSLFDANSRDELVNILGFSKEELKVKVEEAISKMSAKVKNIKTDDAEDPGKPHEPVVSFAEPTHSPLPDETVEVPEASSVESTESEVSNTASDATTTKTTSVLSTIITEPEPSLFGEDINVATPNTDNAADFFSSMGTIRGPIPPHVLVPHTNPAPDSSVAATAGSRPSSVASDALSLKSVTFKMYPKEENAIDKLITQSLVVGAFESAVSLCLSAERYADAILLAVRGGNELLQRTQKAYFEKKTVALPYLRVYQSIVTNDLSDIVQNADLKEWQEIFVVLCTFAKSEEFSNLAEQLGQRLEFQGRITKNSDLSEDEKLSVSLTFRKNATLCYLSASKLEKVVNIWLEEMKEEEDASNGVSQKGDSRYATHAQALQTFIEKVTIFRSATKYVDPELSQSAAQLAANNEAIPRAYKLSSLYDRYFEYADLLASQGLVTLAVEYIKLVPSTYHGLTNTVEFDLARERLLAASGAKPNKTASTSRDPTAGHHLYDSYSSVQQVPGLAAKPHNSYTASVPAPSVPPPYGSHYAPSQPPAQPPYGAPGYGTPNGAPAAYVRNAYAPTAMGSMVPTPPAPLSDSGNLASVPPQAPPHKIEKHAGGWNDAPSIIPKNQIPAPPKRAPILAPFPQSQSQGQAHGSPGQSPGGLPPPPPRGQTPTSRMQGPPRPGSGQGLPPLSRGNQFAPPQGPGSTFTPPPQRGMPPPPGRGMVPSAMPPQGSFGPGPGRTLSPPQQQFSGSLPPPPPPGPGRVTSPPQGQPPMRVAPPVTQPAMRDPRAFGQGTPPPPGRGSVIPLAPPPSTQGPYTRATSAPVGVPPPPTGSFGAAAPQQPPIAVAPPQGPPRVMQAPPPKAATPSAPPKVAPKSEYPPGDRTHIPDASKPIFETFSATLDQLKQTTPPQQRRHVEEIERRVNLLFDALNCETLSPPVLEQLHGLVEAVKRRDHNQALAIHNSLLTTGSRTDDIGIWMSGIKQLLQRL